ncbi:MAG: hypothetical protein KAI72_05340, partial [Candidatus Pacebacteria bacterium]|nr:hypothetical protein [Candidatus Paceibacterota bacterium]
INNVNTGGETPNPLGEGKSDTNVPFADDSDETNNDKFIKISKSEIKNIYDLLYDNSKRKNLKTIYKIEDVSGIYYLRNQLCIIDIEVKGPIIEFYVTNPTDSPKEFVGLKLKTYLMENKYPPLQYYESIEIPAKSKIKFSNKDSLEQWIPNWEKEKAEKIIFEAY